MKEENKYTVNIIWSDEDDCFIATCEEFPSISTHGNSRVETLEEMEVVMEDIIYFGKTDDEVIKLSERDTYTILSDEALEPQEKLMELLRSNNPIA